MISSTTRRLKEQVDVFLLVLQGLQGSELRALRSARELFAQRTVAHLLAPLSPVQLRSSNESPTGLVQLIQSLGFICE